MPAFLFDLDGTLVDSVYQHVLAWRDALEIAGLPLSVWRIHRRIGMSGGLFVNALARETGHNLSEGEVTRMLQLHGEAYRKYAGQVRPLPGARELLDYLAEQNVPHAIATSGYRDSAAHALAALGVDPNLPRRHPRPGGPRQAGSRSLPGRRRAARRRRSRIPS